MRRRGRAVGWVGLGGGRASQQKLWGAASMYRYMGECRTPAVEKPSGSALEGGLRGDYASCTACDGCPGMASGGAAQSQRAHPPGTSRAPRKHQLASAAQQPNNRPSTSTSLSQRIHRPKRYPENGCQQKKMRRDQKASVISRYGPPFPSIDYCRGAAPGEVLSGRQPTRKRAHCGH